MGQETKPPINHEITTDQIACFIDDRPAKPVAVIAIAW